MRSWNGAAGEDRQDRRQTLRRSALLTPALALVLAVPQQCDDPETPAPGADATSAPPTAEAPEAGPADLAEVDPCLLLDETTGPQVGIDDVATGEPSTTNAYRQCLWSVAGSAADESYTVVVGVSETLSIENVQNDLGGTPVTVADRDAVQVEAADGAYCSIYLGVTSTSLAVSDVSGGSGVDQCGLATRVAQLVEPGLP